MFTKILHRPALAIVISMILLFLGLLGIYTLPISQFPDITPPTVEVAIAYPGASANVLVDSVLIPLEQSINGVQNMRYMVSDATSAGEATIRIYFEPGTDPDINVVNVQNRVNIMLNRLPPLVDREGIIVSQVVPSMLMNVNIYSTDPKRRPEIPLQLRQHQHHARDPADPGHGTPHESRQSHVCDAGLAESGPHARLQGIHRRGHEGPGGTERDWFARTTRPGHGHDVAIARIRPDLYRALSTSRSNMPTSF